MEALPDLTLGIGVMLVVGILLSVFGILFLCRKVRLGPGASSIAISFPGGRHGGFFLLCT